MGKKEQKFTETVWRYYHAHGRHNLPWRKTTNPYRILVSEVMLQQTPVDRVLPKYKEFLKQFPTARRLAAAPLGNVLRVWQGLGYNRRAKFLHQAAREVVEGWKGRWPKDELGLRKLPGVGPYTARAVAAFVYNQPVVLIETNVRQVFLHHFFLKETDVSDEEISKLVEKTLSKENAREWYWALMDYGAHLKAHHGNNTGKSKHYTKQSTFRGSDREIRGAIVRVLTQHDELTAAQLCQQLIQFEKGRVATQLTRLKNEELVGSQKGRYFLVNS